MVATTVKRNKTNSSSKVGGTLFQDHVEYVDPRSLRPHPENTYSMDEKELAELTENIEGVGLIEWPLVRRVDDGGLQILSGHRRVKACSKLADQHDERFVSIPVRILENISDEDALVILHSGNFNRYLSRDERIRQFEQLKDKVAVMRQEHPEWKGVRTDDIIASILGYSSTMTYRRQKSIAINLPDSVFSLYEEGLMGETLAFEVSTKDKGYQEELGRYLTEKKPRDKKETAILVEQFDKGAAEYLKEMHNHIIKADVALFRAREILNKKNIVTPSDKERMWAMRDALDRMLKHSKVR